MQTYLIAKYVDDIRRNEPVNVGVIVFDGARVTARFEGEDDVGRIDKRKLRRHSGRDAYVAWVAHWRRLIAEQQPADALISASSQDFYLERGGVVLLDLDARALNDTVNDLYARLVKPDDPPAPMSLQEKSQRALRLAGADLEDDTRFRTDIAVTLDVGGQQFDETFSYGVRNGTWHYLQEVSFDPQKPRVSRKEANHCAFLMEHADISGSRLVLYDAADIDESTAPLLELVQTFAPAVDVGDPDGAVVGLRSQLALADGAE
jgi:hypothetical protein